jgi:hypothetical protein
MKVIRKAGIVAILRDATTRFDETRKPRRGLADAACVK